MPSNSRDVTDGISQELGNPGDAGSGHGGGGYVQGGPAGVLGGVEPPLNGPAGSDGATSVEVEEGC